jgi:hypothetical protein
MVKSALPEVGRSLLISHTGKEKKGRKDSFLGKFDVSEFSSWY